MGKTKSCKNLQVLRVLQGLAYIYNLEYSLWRKIKLHIPSPFCRQKKPTNKTAPTLATWRRGANLFVATVGCFLLFLGVSPSPNRLLGGSSPDRKWEQPYLALGDFLSMVNHLHPPRMILQVEYKSPTTPSQQDPKQSIKFPSEGVLFLFFLLLDGCLKLTLHTHVACLKMFCFEAFGSFWHLATMYGGEVVGNSWDFCTRHLHQSNKSEMEDLIWSGQIRHTTVGKRSAFERCILILAYSLLLAFVSPTTVLEIRFVVKTSGLVNAGRRQVWVSWRPRAPAPMVPWWNDGKVKEFVSHGTPRPDEIQIFTHGFVWTRKSKQKLLWLKGFNFLTQPQEKAWLNHLSSKIVWKVKMQRLWKRQTLRSTNTPLNFILVTLPNKIGHFCHLGNEFLLICGYTSPPWKIRIRWSFSLWKKRLAVSQLLWIFRWGYVQRNLSFLPRQRLDFKVKDFSVPRGLTVRPLKRWVVGRRAIPLWGFWGHFWGVSKKTWGVIPRCKMIRTRWMKKCWHMAQTNQSCRKPLLLTHFPQ